MNFIEIPYENLSQEALLGVVRDFIGREGTDYGEFEYSAEEKETEVLQQIYSGRAKIYFNHQDQSVTLLSPSQIIKLNQLH